MSLHVNLVVWWTVGKISMCNCIVINIKWLIVDQDVVASCWRIFTSFSITKIIVMATAKLFHSVWNQSHKRWQGFSLQDLIMWPTPIMLSLMYHFGKNISCNYSKLCKFVCNGSFLHGPKEAWKQAYLIVYIYIYIWII